MKKIWIIIALLAGTLNLLDMAVTQWVIQTGEFEEVNPLMQSALNYGTFIQIKVLYSIVVCYLGIKFIKYRSIKTAVSIVFIFYSMVIFSHVRLLIK